MSTLFSGFRTATRQSGGMRDGREWLQDKAAHDGAEGLWRVNDSLYDLTPFIAKVSEEKGGIFGSEHHFYFDSLKAIFLVAPWWS